MTTYSVLLLIAAVIVVLVIIWLVRSRGNTAGRHIDTSLTAVGAVTEAAEDIADAVTEKVEDFLIADAEATGLVDDVVTALEHDKAASRKSAGRAAALPIGVPAAKGAPDNLRQLKGVGPKLGTLLTELGIARFDQIAAWGPAEIEKVDAHLGTFKGRIVRDNWIEQAGFLAKGDVAGFEAKFGKLDSPGNS